MPLMPDVFKRDASPGEQVNEIAKCFNIGPIASRMS
jgi:hypothetical protein